MNSANNLRELESRSFSSQSSDGNPSLADTLIANLCDTKQRTQLSHAQICDPWKLK